LIFLDAKPIEKALVGLVTLLVLYWYHGIAKSKIVLPYQLQKHNIFLLVVVVHRLWLSA